MKEMDEQIKQEQLKILQEQNVEIQEAALIFEKGDS